jgi:hypothetical protein
VATACAAGRLMLVDATVSCRLQLQCTVVCCNANCAVLVEQNHIIVLPCCQFVK